MLATFFRGASRSDPAGESPDKARDMSSLFGDGTVLDIAVLVRYPPRRAPGYVFSVAESGWQIACCCKEHCRDAGRIVQNLLETNLDFSLIIYNGKGEFVVRDE